MFHTFLAFVIFIALSQSVSATESKSNFVDVNAFNPAQAMLNYEAENPTSSAIIRGDGAIVDDSGVVVGIRNIDDPRNTENEFYYNGVDENGNVIEGAEFKVFKNPKSLFIDYVKQKVGPYDPDQVDVGSGEVVSRFDNVSKRSETGVYEYNNGVRQ